MKLKIKIYIYFLKRIYRAIKQELLWFYVVKETGMFVSGFLLMISPADNIKLALFSA